jgi:hypothetical protein
LPNKVYKLDAACGGKTYDNAARYEGAGPHPVAVFMPTELGQLLPTTPGPPKGAFWPPANPSDPAAVQLVACGRLVAQERLTGQVCGPYVIPGPPVTVPMAAATYEIRIYELRTHRLIQTATVKGEDTDCSPVISANYTPETFLSDLTFPQWQTVLHDPVTKNL